MNEIIDIDFYNNIKCLLQEAKQKVEIAVNSAMVITYWNIGKMIVEKQNGQERAEYGEKLILELAKQMTIDFGKGFGKRNLERMRNFYMTFPIASTVSSQLSWSHYLELISVANEERRNFYLNECIKANWSVRQLSRQIASSYYDRLLATKLENKEDVKNEINLTCPKESIDVIKSPYILEFLGLDANPSFYEKDLEKALITNIQKFLLELGRGFSFVERQKRLSSDNNHYFVDLVFYNYILKCFVLIDLKTDKLSFNDLGQIDFYVRYYDLEVKQKDDNPTIGIVLCPTADKTLLKYSFASENKNLFISKYKTYMPTEEEISRLIEEEKKLIAEFGRKTE